MKDRNEEYERLSKEIKKNPPLFNLGDLVIVHSDTDVQKAVQGKIKTAEFFVEWFYGIEVEESGKKIMIYSYEKDTGDARTRIIYPPKD
jgi:hypothetical protein